MGRPNPLQTQTRVLLIGYLLKQPKEPQGPMSLRKLAHRLLNRPKTACQKKRHRIQLIHLVERRARLGMVSTSKLFRRRFQPPRPVRKGELTVGLRHRASRIKQGGWIYRPDLAPCSAIRYRCHHQARGACWTESGDQPDGILRLPVKIRNMTKSKLELTISLIMHLRVTW